MSTVQDQMGRLAKRMLSSVRVRVTATALLAVGCALGVSFLLVDTGLANYRHRVLMATAAQQARMVVALNPRLTTPLVLPADPNIDSGLVQVIRDNRVLGASRPLRHYPPLWYPGGPVKPDFLEGLAPDVRTVAVQVNNDGAKGVVVVVASLQQYDHSVAYIQRLLDIGTPMLLLVVGVIIWLIVGRALRPIEMMRREVAEVATLRGGYRVAEPGNDDEVGRLARTLNSMLDRIQASSERERRFVSDASHELRSPIANIRTELEVALHHPAVTDWELVAGEVLNQNQRMEQLVSGLLLLARSDEGSLPADADPVDLAGVVGDVTGGVGNREIAETPDVRVETSPALVPVPAVYLERIVRNLVDNARRFASTAVTVTVARDGAEAVLTVEDDGPGVPPAERTRIFERFVRLDEARDRGEGGFGLGLAIVADLSRFYGGRIEVTDAHPGARFVLHLPAVSGSVGRANAAESPGPPAGQAVRVPAT